MNVRVLHHAVVVVRVAAPAIPRAETREKATVLEGLLVSKSPIVGIEQSGSIMIWGALPLPAATGFGEKGSARVRGRTAYSGARLADQIRGAMDPSAARERPRHQEQGVG
ncbi:hypothetical protein [Haladaptatus halobius]|uniref:hypothetical protein n=1 Tax=Haladaptatus halobius TaxID=2884875 RepID=UPI001D0ABF55|nr:hypothetical protein [Haladaptatus halobius]